MKTSNEFKMNKVVNYVNNNIDELKQKMNGEDSMYVYESVLTHTGFAFMSDEDYRMTLIDKIEELISK